MALKVSTGITRKLGLPEYCSIGASCHVEFELDGSLLHNDLDSFQQKVHDAYVACCQAVNDELARHGDNSSVDRQSTPPITQQQQNGSSNGNGANGRPATEKQLKFVNQLAGRIGELRNGHLGQLTQRMYGKELSSLTSLEASGLIDTLKAIKEGRIDVAAALNGGSS